VRLTRAFGTFAVLYNVVDKLFGAGYIAQMGDQGLDVAEIGIILTVGSLLLAVVNFPTGVLADLWGRKRTAALGFVVLGFALLGYGQAGSLAAFLAAMTGWAVGMALISGAPQAWVVHELNRHGASDSRTTILSRVSSVGLVTGALAGLLATPLLAAELRLVFFVAGALALVSAGVLVAVGEDNRDPSGRPSALPRAVLTSGRELLANPAMRLALLKVSLRQVGFVVFLLSYQLAVTRILGLPVSALGPVLAASIVALALGMWMVPTLCRRLSLPVVSLLGTGVCAAGLAGMAMSTSAWLWIAGLVLFEWGLGVDLASFGSLLHEFILDRHRSGWLSALDSLQTLIGAVGTLLAGLLIETVGFRPVWFGAAVAIVVGAVPVFLLGRRNRSRTDLQVTHA
jgi:MFS family permease